MGFVKLVIVMEEDVQMTYRKDDANLYKIKTLSDCIPALTAAGHFTAIDKIVEKMTALIDKLE